MEKFITKILFFLLPIALLAYPLDYALSHIIKQSHEYPGEFEVWNDIYSGKANCDLAIYGSSRAWLHISPQVLADSLEETVYNFGIDGHNFWLQYLRHKEFLKHNNKPKTIVLSLDVFTLQKRIDLYKAEQFLPYMLLNNDIMEFTSSYIGYKSYDYYIPLIRYAGKTSSLNTCLQILTDQTNSKNFRTHGFLGMDRKWNTDLKKAKASRKSYEFELDSSSTELFENFIKECKALEIDLILVYTPEYIEGQKFVPRRSEIINVFETTSKRYGLSFYDYSDLDICFDKSLFYNASHLNKGGAEVFSKILAADLKARRDSMQRLESLSKRQQDNILSSKPTSL